jgi:hypothetical protein
MEYGPVDVVIVAMGEPKFDGSILSELENAVDSGVIRVLDAMVLMKEADDTVVGLDVEDLPEFEKEKLGFIETGTRGLFDSEDAATLAEGLVPGSAVVALAIEHKWAIPLTQSLVAVGADAGLRIAIPASIVNERMAELSA